MFRSGSTICCPDWGTDGLLRIRRIGGRPEVAPQVSSRLIETVRARERAGHQHVGAGRLRNDCWRCGANQNDLPAPSARTAEIVMFRPVRRAPHGSFMASTQVSSPLRGSGGTYSPSGQCSPLPGRNKSRTPTTIHRIQILKAELFSRAIDLKQSLHQDLKTPLNGTEKGI